MNPILKHTLATAMAKRTSAYIVSPLKPIATAVRQVASPQPGRGMLLP